MKLATWMDKNLLNIIETRTKVVHKNVSHAKIFESWSFLVRYKRTYILKKWILMLMNKDLFCCYFILCCFAKEIIYKGLRHSITVYSITPLSEK